MPAEVYMTHQKFKGCFQALSFLKTDVWISIVVANLLSFLFSSYCLALEDCLGCMLTVSMPGMWPKRYTGLLEKACIHLYHNNATKATFHDQMCKREEKRLIYLKGEAKQSQSQLLNFIRCHVHCTGMQLEDNTLFTFTVTSYACLYKQSTTYLNSCRWILQHQSLGSITVYIHFCKSQVYTESLSNYVQQWTAYNTTTYMSVTLYICTLSMLQSYLNNVYSLTIMTCTVCVASLCVKSTYIRLQQLFTYHLRIPHSPTQFLLCLSFHCLVWCHVAHARSRAPHTSLNCYVHGLLHADSCRLYRQ